MDKLINEATSLLISKDVIEKGFDGTAICQFNKSVVDDLVFGILECFQEDGEVSLEKKHILIGVAFALVNRQLTCPQVHIPLITSEIEILIEMVSEEWFIDLKHPEPLVISEYDLHK